MCESVSSGCCEICNKCVRLLNNSSCFLTSNFSTGTSNTYNMTYNDKENYCLESPQTSSPSKPIKISQFTSPLRQRQPLEDYDPNSQDSGYGAVFAEKDDKIGFRFAEPSGLPPRKISLEPSPRKDSPSPLRNQCFRSNSCISFGRSLSSSSGSESLDEGLFELLENDQMEEDIKVPSGMNILLSGKIYQNENIGPNIYKPEEEKHLFRRKLLSERSAENLTPTSSRARSCLFKTANSENSIPSPNKESPNLPIRPFKRPEPLSTADENCQAQQHKKRKFTPFVHSISENLSQNYSTNRITGSVKFQRSFSENETTIMKALQRSSVEPDLIGDFSRPFALPLMLGRHQDLKTISSDTLAELINGNYNTSVESYTIVDCRYPYEYNGGHIKGAKNVYTKDQVLKELVDPVKLTPNKHKSSGKRNIVIFHCEFSSERGPSLSRFLRNSDRDMNKECYPALNYPELYLLHGGYKGFYERYKDLCEPQSYCSMLDPEHSNDLKLFRAKTRSWNGDKNKMALRTGLRRLGI